MISSKNVKVSEKLCIGTSIERFTSSSPSEQITVYGGVPCIKVASDNSLIHAFACSLFVGVYLVISNMIGCSHSCHSIKLIHCGAPQKDHVIGKLFISQSDCTEIKCLW